MLNNPILIIGNKPNKYLNLDKLVDSYKTNYRCNFGLAGFNNTGTKKSYLGLCCHMYRNLIIEKPNKEVFIMKYIEYFERSYIENIYNTFNPDDYKKVSHVKNNRIIKALYNAILQLLGSQFRFIKIPRTGIALVFQNLIRNRKIFITGFTVTQTKRETFYTKNDKDFESVHHDSKSEIAILRWLHVKKYIDLTFCMLEDSSEFVIDCGDKEIKPTLFGLKKLSELEKPIYLKNVDFNFLKKIMKNFCEEIDSKKIVINNEN